MYATDNGDAPEGVVHIEEENAEEDSNLQTKEENVNLPNAVARAAHVYLWTFCSTQSA